MRLHSFLFMVIASACALAGCAGAGDAGAGDTGAGVEGHEGDPENETDPSLAESSTGESSDELATSVDCRERTDTAYTNGQPSRIQVITVGGKPVSKPTGHAFLKMQEAARAEAGVTITLVSGFRTMAEQKYLYDCYRTGKCNNGNLAARPGYSNHQNGKAVDLTTSTWLARNAGRFGFVRTVPSENWHYEFSGADPGGPCSANAYPVASRFESPKEGGWYTNGIWLKLATPDVRIRRVAYWAGAYALGESTDADGQFALRYTFNTLGDRSVTAKGYDAAGKQISETTVSFRITE